MLLALRRIAEQLSDQLSDQKVTMLRFSEATKYSEGTAVADMNAVTFATVTTTTNPLTDGAWHYVNAVIDYANDSVNEGVD